jgi:hypothetical protein
MPKFLTFETTAVKLNDSIFPSNTASFSLQASTVPVFDINGNLIDYAPNGPIQGKFSTEFYLTGALPDYLKFDNQTDVPISISFNNFNIPSAFLTNLSFSVQPYQPILVSTSFDFYHGLLSLNTDLNDTHNLFRPANGTTQIKNELATLNGLTSYIVTSNRSTYAQNPYDFIVSNFNYSFTVDRQPLLRVKQSIPSRVAVRQVNGEFGITANNIDGLLDIHGNEAIFTSILKDSQNPNVYTAIGLTGIIIDQNYVVSDSSYGVANIKMIQNITKKRNIVTIPFGNDAPEIFELLPPVTKIFIPDPPPEPVIPIPPIRRPQRPVTPPINPPPELDPDLIWFNIYAGVTKLNENCRNKPSSLNNIKTANAIDSFIENDNIVVDGIKQKIHYKINFANVQSEISMNKNIDSDGNNIPYNYFVCTIGINKNVLALNLSSPGFDIATKFNSYKLTDLDDPCYTENLSENDPARYLGLKARATTYVPKYNENGEQDGCQIEFPPGGSTLCASWKIYKTWNELIYSMQNKYNEDPDKTTYEIIYLMIS